MGWSRGLACGVFATCVVLTAAPHVVGMGPVSPAGTGEAEVHAAPDATPVPPSESRRLGQPPARSGSGADERASAPSNNGWLVRSMVGLGVVLGLALLLRILIGNMSARSGSIRAQLGAGGRAPSGLLEVLARYPVSRAQTLVLLRVDRRVLLLSQGAGGFRPLSEITDAESVASIISQADDDAGESMTARFNDLLRQVERGDGADDQAPVHQARHAAQKASGSAHDRAVGEAIRQMRGVSA